MAADGSGNLEGKVFLVTGGTEGIGKAACSEFARRGATLVLVGRNREKTERVASELTVLANGRLVETCIADMSSLDEIRGVAKSFKAKHDRLDVLVNNAGAVFFTHQLSADGFEMTFALNHLGYFLLTHELLHVIRRTEGARVVSTSSGAHNMGNIDFAEIARRPSHAAGFNVYGDTKLANILFTRELAKHLEGSSATATCFHPGFVESGFGKNNQGFLPSMIAIGASLFGRTPEKGAETLIWLATNAETPKPNGGYFHDKKIGKTKKAADDAELAKRLWTFSAELCGVSE